jgi:hypothetical protein
MAQELNPKRRKIGKKIRRTGIKKKYLTANLLHFLVEAKPLVPIFVRLIGN